MLKLIEIESDYAACEATVTLTFDERQKTRNHVFLDDGREAGIFLPRGQTLKHGSIIKGEDGQRIKIIAAEEAISSVQTDDPLMLARLCYHLGNRHIPLQIKPGSIHYRTDHVLDQMVEQLGFSVMHETLPFEPESGAYHRHHHA